jgi:hypothetical protein
MTSRDEAPVVAADEQRVVAQVVEPPVAAEVEQEAGHRRRQAAQRAAQAGQLVRREHVGVGDDRIGGDPLAALQHDAGDGAATVLDARDALPAAHVQRRRHRLDERVARRRRALPAARRPAGDGAADPGVDQRLRKPALPA